MANPKPVKRKTKKARSRNGFCHSCRTRHRASTPHDADLAARALYQLIDTATGAVEWTGSIDSNGFLEANGDLSDAELARVLALRPGEEIRLGGGAAPLVTLRRVPEQSTLKGQHVTWQEAVIRQRAGTVISEGDVWCAIKAEPGGRVVWVRVSELKIKKG